MKMRSGDPNTGLQRSIFAPVSRRDSSPLQFGSDAISCSITDLESRVAEELVSGAVSEDRCYRDTDSPKLKPRFGLYHLKLFSGEFSGHEFIRLRSPPEGSVVREVRSRFLCISLSLASLCCSVLSNLDLRSLTSLQSLSDPASITEG